MSLEIVARLDRRFPIQSGATARGPWSKQEFIVETQETYPKKICINVWGQDKVDELSKFADGDLLKFSVNIESREYNGRWYTDIRAWKLERADINSTAQSADAPSSYNTPAAPILDSADLDGGEDDLPF